MVCQEADRHAQLHILGIAGNMRQGSYSTQVLKMVLEEAKKYKRDTHELRQVNLSIYDPSASNESNNNNDKESVML